MHHIYVYTHVHEHTRLAKPGLCSGGRISYFANRIQVHCLVPILLNMMIVKVLIIVHCLVPHSTTSYKWDNDSNNGTNYNNTNKNNTSKKNKVVIVVLPALILIVIRATIICSNILNIDTNHNNSNSCSSTTTIATINTNTRK